MFVASKSTLISCHNLRTNPLPGNMAFSIVLQPALNTPVPTRQVAPHHMRNTDVEHKSVNMSTGILTLMILVLVEYLLNGVEPSLWERHLLCPCHVSVCTQSKQSRR